MRLILLLAIVLVPRASAAQTQWQIEDRLFGFGLGVYAVSAAWDAKTTVDCARAKVCREANPVYVPIVNKHGVKTAMLGKLAVQTAIAGFLIYERPRHRKATAVALGLLAGAQIGVDVVNYRRLQRAQR